jgi:hypothetical protein
LEHETGDDRPVTNQRSSARANVAALAVGLAYGLVARALFSPWIPGVLRESFSAVSVAFVFVVPFALGYLTVHDASMDRPTSWGTWIVRPWAASVLLAAGLMALAWEGAICVVMVAPVFLVMSSIGGITAGRIAERRRLLARSRSRTTLAGVLLLPFAWAPVEQRFEAPTAMRTVHTQLYVRADADTVFDNVAEVRAIRQDERRPSFFSRIGIPRPSEATLSYPGVGALRDARFVEGIRFREKVTRFEPGRALAFTIAVDPRSVDARVLDEHVRVGGPFFDVEYGEFRIEPAADGVVLHLSSRHRLTTHFNAYAGLWTDAVMADLQREICDIIRRRSER